MSTLSDPEKRVLEALLGMGSGYVLDFTDDSFDAFVARYGVDIHGPAYQSSETSNAETIRALWDTEDDVLVRDVVEEPPDSYEASWEIGGREPNASVNRAQLRAVRYDGPSHDFSPRSVEKSLLEATWQQVQSTTL